MISGVSQMKKAMILDVFFVSSCLCWCGILELWVVQSCRVHIAILFSFMLLVIFCRL